MGTSYGIELLCCLSKRFTLGFYFRFLRRYSFPQKSMKNGARMRKNRHWLALSVISLLCTSLVRGAGPHYDSPASRETDVPAPAIPSISSSTQSGEPVQQGQNLSCTILATSQPWNPPGVMDVSIDGSSVGSFKFGPNGSEALDFTCRAGKHGLTFAVENTNTSCSASFTVSGGKTKFSPMMWIAPNGTVSCGLQ